MSSTQLLGLLLALGLLPCACAQAPASRSTAPAGEAQREPAQAPAAYVVSACYRPSPDGGSSGPARCVLVREVAGAKSGLVQCLEQLVAEDDVGESSSVVEGGAWTRARDELRSMKTRLADNPPASRGGELPHRLLFYGSPSDRAIGCLGIAELRECGEPFARLWSAIETLGSECQ